MLKQRRPYKITDWSVRGRCGVSPLERVGRARGSTAGEGLPLPSIPFETWLSISSDRDAGRYKVDLVRDGGHRHQRRLRFKSLSGSTPNASANRTITMRDGLRRPRSMPPTYVRSISASKPSCSCVRPRSCRKRRTLSPTMARQSIHRTDGIMGLISREHSPYWASASSHQERIRTKPLSLKKISIDDFQRNGDQLDLPQRRIPISALDLTEVLQVNARSECNIFLRQTEKLPPSPDISADESPQIHADNRRPCGL